MIVSNPQLLKLKKEQAPSHLDILFLTRTPRKQRYFTAVARTALKHLRCRVVSYHDLPESCSVKIPEADLHSILGDALDELFNARRDRVSRCLIPIVQHIRIIQIQKIYRRLYLLLHSTEPRLIAVWNGEKFQDRVLHCVNKTFKCPVAYFENGVLPHSTTLDFNGVNAKNSVPRTPEFYLQQPLARSYNKKIVPRKFKNQSREKAKSMALPSHYILVPFQKDRDSQILHNSCWIKSMQQLFNIMLQALELQNDNALQIVFREHPDASTQYPELHQLAAQQPRIQFNNQSDLQEAIQGAVAVVTINSSVGMDSLLLNQKVIVLGRAFYSLPGLVKRASNLNELILALNTITQFQLDQKLKDQFVDYLEKNYVIKGDWRFADAQHFQSLKQKFDEFIAQHPMSFRVANQ